MQNLVFRKNLTIDKSIHTAYIQAIRSAQHFIYIENQYFLGSLYAWPSPILCELRMLPDIYMAGADNLIPIELALKIARVPTAASVQEILFFQSQTMEMMYKIIADELKAMDIKDLHPEDYLNFFVLEIGKNRHLTAALTQINLQTKVQRPRLQKSADDEYVILGSANINQRSLAGTRDTEIAMGIWMAEHLRMVDDRFNDPSSLDCVNFVNEIAKENWKKFTYDEMKTLQGHLLKYPVKVEADGKISPLPDQECFPDVGGKILGAPTSLPDSLTM
ncbi:hypothetical protein U9M48_015048 [Paspalum notatum var. saurae]|uniref:Phospholipase D C-terminal domain-containing protein n=1 Tax=Paspalum notatum var. saurae TaxID=547442 RepID=A0AAQ3T5M6_PASNO